VGNLLLHANISAQFRNMAIKFHIIFIGIQPFRPVWAETRAHSGDWYGSGTLHLGQVLRGSLPLFSPTFRRSHFRPPGASTSTTTREILAAEGGTVGENVVR